MKTLARVMFGASPEHMDQLRKFCPEGCKYETNFDAWLLTSDVRFKMTIDALEHWGYRAWDYTGSKEFGKEYEISLVREYEPSDFELVRYMEFWPDPVDAVSDEGRDEQGRLMLERPTLKKAKHSGLDFASATLGRMLVLQPVRDLLTEGGFRHLAFRPTVLITGRGTRPRRHAPIPWEQFKVTPSWWELHSDLVLPPLSPSMDLRDWNGKPVQPGDCSNGCVPRDGFYNHAELHYRRSDLARVGPFDAALTFEHRFANNAEDTRHTIVSKRFYDYCQAKGLKGRWAPVRIDEG
jgi:hypothetical protein